MFTTDWLVTLFKDFRGTATESVTINAVETDSRIKMKKSLFIPLAGEKFDGHDYIKQALDNGAVAAFWQKEKPLPDFLPEEFFVFFVEDTLQALQQLARAYREKIDPIVIGITGSNGKTTTKDLVSAVVASKYKIHSTKGNFNNHIGLPLTILSMEQETEILVLEMGMNHFGEIETLTNIASPDYAVITNIGEAHIEYLGSREGIAKAKLEIIQGLKRDGVFIFDGDESLLRNRVYGQETITCGFNKNNDIVIRDVSIDPQHTVFRLNNEEKYHIPLLGKHHAQNATFAITVGKKLGLSRADIQMAFDGMKITSMRFEMLEGKNGSVVINDAYNASPSSMRASIEVVKQLEPYTSKVLVLGDMFELGAESEKWHRQVADFISDSIAAVFTYGSSAKYIASQVHEKLPNIICKHFESKSELANSLQAYLTEGTLIMFKASRGMNFETIVKETLAAPHSAE